MYLAFFNLREAPFNLTPDPRFLFLSPQHEEALSHLLYGIYERRGFIEITGEVGMGKTVLCRALLERLDDKVSTALIFNSYLNKQELVEAILHDFGLTPPEDSTSKGMIDMLNTYLLEEFAAGRNAVVVIDEAQNLEATVLEQLRMLSNLETERVKLLQVVLVGQPELRDKLSAPHMRQLDQRIAVRFHLRELGQQETAQYILHRMSVAGAGTSVTFTRRALRLIYQYSNGLPRRINLLCDRALMTAFVRAKRRITAAMVRRSITDLEGARYGVASRRRRGFGFFKRLILGSLVSLGALALCAGLLLLPSLREHLPASMQTQLQPMLVPPAPAVQPAPQPLTLPPSPPPVVTATPTALPALPTVSTTDQELARTLWRLKVHAEALLETAPARRFASWEPLLNTVARDLGLEIMPLNTALLHLQEVSRPCLIEVIDDATTGRLGLWVLAKGQVDSILVYQEPEGLRSVSLRHVQQIWNGALYLSAEEGTYRGVLLKAGMVGERVVALQQALKARGYLSELPSGQFDAATFQAVKRFQRDNQLAIDGQAGRQTLMMLLHFGGNLAERAT